MKLVEEIRRSPSPLVSFPERSDLRRVTSEDLVGPSREVLIRHAGFDYRLRITRQGKLILTK